MKEVTYEDWLKNPTSRMMWVWDDDEKDKVKQKVVYVVKGSFSVITTSDIDTGCTCFQHCAEIEKPRRMTNKELSWWLSEKPHRARTSTRSSYICSYYTYLKNEQDEEVPNNILIREGDGEWREPLVEAQG